MTSVRPPRDQPPRYSSPLDAPVGRSSRDPRLVTIFGTSALPRRSKLLQNAATDATSRVLLKQKFGPALGLTRLERWERADKLDLSPPADVLRILQEVGDDDPEFRECVWERIV